MARHRSAHDHQVRHAPRTADLHPGTSRRVAGLPGSGTIKPDGVRPTCASLLAALDVHPRIAMRILRHSKIALTMEIYTEALEDSTLDQVRLVPAERHAKLMPAQRAPVRRRGRSRPAGLNLDNPAWRSLVHFSVSPQGCRLGRRDWPNLVGKFKPGWSTTRSTRPCQALPPAVTLSDMACVDAPTCGSVPRGRADRRPAAPRWSRPSGAGSDPAGYRRSGRFSAPGELLGHIVS